MRYVFCPNRNVFATMLSFNGLAELPSYLQRSCYIPKHLGKHSPKRTKLKMKIFYGLALTRIQSKASLFCKGCTACKQTYWMVAVIFCTKTSRYVSYSVSNQHWTSSIKPLQWI